MANAKPILYGVSDFVRMRTEGAYYSDRTVYIRDPDPSNAFRLLIDDLAAKSPSKDGQVVSAAGVAQ